VILLTGATGLVGSALLRRMTAAGEPVRCLVRDPRRLGADRVRVQIALGDLADPPSFRNALRGVRTVVHLAAAIRDQRAGSIEELNGIATWRMVQAAERAGVEHFVFFSSLGASSHDRTRVLRAKALAERAVLASDVRHTVFAPSLVYAPGDRLLTFLERLALLSPVMPISGRGEALYQPIWAEDVADCVVNLLARPAGVAGSARGHARFELAGPQTLSHREIVDLVLHAAGRPRRMVSVPAPLVCRALRAAEVLLKSRAPATWDEAELLEVSMMSESGTADVEGLRVTPRPMHEVLGVPPTAAPARAAPRSPAAVPRSQAGR
jgi:NADH dehydrogenase